MVGYPERDRGRHRLNGFDFVKGKQLTSLDTQSRFEVTRIRVPRLPRRWPAFDGLVFWYRLSVCAGLRCQLVEGEPFGPRTTCVHGRKTWFVNSCVWSLNCLVEVVSPFLIVIPVFLKKTSQDTWSTTEKLTVSWSFVLNLPGTNKIVNLGVF